MSATIRERIATPSGLTARAADEEVAMAREVREEHWAGAMDRARVLATERGARVLAIITPGRTPGVTWLDLYVEPRP